MFILLIVVGSAGSGRLSVDAYGVMGVTALEIFTRALTNYCLACFDMLTSLP